MNKDGPNFGSDLPTNILMWCWFHMAGVLNTSLNTNVFFFPILKHAWLNPRKAVSSVVWRTAYLPLYQWQPPPSLRILFLILSSYCSAPPIHLLMSRYWPFTFYPLICGFLQAHWATYGFPAFIQKHVISVWGCDLLIIYWDFVMFSPQSPALTLKY